MKYKIFILLSSALLLAAQAQAYTDISIYTQPSQPMVNDPVKIFIQLVGFAPPPSLPVFITNASVVLHIDGVEAGNNRTDKDGITTFGYSFKTPGEHNLTAYYTGDAGYDAANKSILLKVLGVSPASITNLTNISYAPTYINWTWSDPADLNFYKVMIYLDGSFKTNVSKGVQYYNATGFALNTTHTIATRTVDTSGSINQTWVNHTAKTALSDTTTSLKGDINGDCKVDYKDLAILGAAYGTSKGDAGYIAAADLNGDDKVDYRDLGILGANYGKAC